MLAVALHNLLADALAQLSVDKFSQRLTHKFRTVLQITPADHQVDLLHQLVIHPGYKLCHTQSIPICITLRYANLDEGQHLVDRCDAFAVTVGAVVVGVKQERRETGGTCPQYIVVERVTHVGNAIPRNALERG
jgi:hypothetical protein